MNKIIFLLAVIMLISCNEKINDKKVNAIEANNLKTAPYNLADLGDGKKYNYDTLSAAYIKKVKESLLKREFKFPSQEKFKEKISEVFNIKVYDYKNSIVVLRPAMFTEIAIKEHRFILIEDPETDSDPDNINADLEYYYNSYVFYGDKKAFNWLKINNKETLEDLVVQYGYSSDLDLIKFVFKDFDFSNKIMFSELIFDRKEKLEVRENILDKIILVNYGGKSKDFSSAKEGDGFEWIGEIVHSIKKNPNNYTNPDKTIAILLDKDLQIGVVGYAEEFLHENPDFKSFLKKNNYFNLERLKSYVEYVLDQNPNDSKYDKSTYVINDSDGFTNLRKDKSSTSVIIEKIKSGEKVEILNDSGNWRLIKTNSGNTGYVYKTKLQAVN